MKIHILTITAIIALPLLAATTARADGGFKTADPHVPSASVIPLAAPDYDDITYSVMPAPEKIKIFNFSVPDSTDRKRVEKEINDWLGDKKDQKCILKWDITSSMGTVTIIYHYSLIKEIEEKSKAGKVPQVK